MKRNKKLGSSGVWKRGCYGALLGREGGGGGNARQCIVVIIKW